MNDVKIKFDWDNLESAYKFFEDKTLSCIFPTYWPQTLDAYRNYGAMEVRTLEVVKLFAKLGCQVNVLAPKGSHLPIKNVKVLTGDYGSWDGSGVHPYNLEKNLVECNLDALKSSDAVLEDDHFRPYTYLKSKYPEQYPHSAFSFDFHSDQISTLPLYPQNIIAVSKWLLSALREKFKNQGHKFWHAYSGLIRNNYPSEFDPSLIEKDLYLFLCRFSKVKSPALILELAKENPDDRFVMIGDVAFCLSGGTRLRCRHPLKNHASIETVWKLEKLYSQEYKVELLSPNGQYYPVQIKKRLRNSQERILKIILRNGKEIVATEDHKFPTNKGLVPVRSIWIGDGLEYKVVEFADSKLGSASFGRFVGLYIAEGCKSSTQVSFCFHEKENNYVAFVKAFAEDLGAHVNIIHRVESHSKIVTISSISICALIDDFVGGKKAITKFLKSKIFRMGKDFRQALLKGWIEGDGDERKNLYTSSSKLKDNAIELHESLGYIVSVAKRKGKGFRGIGENLNPSYQIYRVGYYKNSEMRRFDEGFVPVVGVEIVHDVGDETIGGGNHKLKYVYDIIMPTEDHLFLISGGILSHNSNEPHYAMAIKNIADKMSNIKVIFNASYEEKIEYLQRCVGLLHPGFWDGPLEWDILEGLYFGSRILAFDRGAAREIYRNKEQGIIAPFTNNETQNIEIYKRAFKIYKKLDIKSEDCRQRALDFFDFKVHSFPKYLDVLFPQKESKS